MWKCVKCETNNEDSQAVCSICGMKMMVSKKICYERSLHERKAESDTKTGSASYEYSSEKKMGKVSDEAVKTVKYDRTVPVSGSDSAEKSDSVKKLEELESSLENVDTLYVRKKHRGIKALEIVMIIVAVLLLVVIAAVCTGIFVLF